MRGCAIIAVVLSIAAPALACVGDCDRDCRVDVTEILTAVQIALGDQQLVRCAYADRDQSGSVEVDEVLSTVDAALTGCAATLSFAPGERYRVGDSPRSLVLADLDGDGAAEIVTANHGSNDVTVLINELGRFFSAGPATPVGEIPLGIAAGDFDRDGHADVATANGRSGDVSVLFGAGDGSFLQTSTYAIGRDARTILAADIDGNSAVDLVVAAPGMGGIPLLMNRGDGQFDRIVVGAGFQPWWIALGDVTGDGRRDLVSANGESGDLTILAANPAGGFTPRSRLPLPALPFSVAIGDVDGDGAADLLTGNGRDASVSLLRSRRGSFAAPVRIPFGPGPYAVHLHDLDADGALDIVTVSESDVVGSIALRRGNGDGSFADEHRINVGRLPYAVAAADIDRDGALDLVAAVGASDEVVVLRQSRCR